MSKKSLIYVVVFASLIAAAFFIYSSVKRSSTPLPLSISADSVVLKRGCVSADSSCLYISFQFPVVKGVSDQTISMFLYTDYLQAIGDSSKVEFSGTIHDYLKRVTLQYDSLFTEYQSAFPDGAVNTWYLKARFDTLYVNSNLLCLEYYTENYMGGAYGNYSYHYFNFNPLMGKLVSLSDVFSDMGVFLEKAEDAFRKHFKLSQGTSLADYWFPNSKFQLPAEFGFSKEGVVLHYNVYEIGPYSDGDIVFTVPYAEIEPILMPEFTFLAKP